MLQLIRSGHAPRIPQLIRQRRHAESVAMRWTPCPVMEHLAHHAAQDATDLHRRLDAAIARERREHDEFWRRVSEREQDEEHARRQAEIARRRPLI